MKMLHFKEFRFSMLFALATSLAAFTSCGGGSDEPDPTPNPGGNDEYVDIKMVSTNPSEGQEVDAATNTITVTYNYDVELASGAGATLNGNSVSLSTSGKDLKASVTLEAGKSYTFEVPASAVKAKGYRSYAPAVKLSFKTTPKQADPSQITANLCNPNSNDAAKALYKLLLDNYGKKTFSAVMADVNWNNNIADKIFNLTGKYPAMNCYDFIHIYVPKQQWTWIDYYDITPVTEWANAGGIVSLMWHFNVPLNEQTVPGEDGSGVTCTPSETTFKAANALKDGTWENKWFNEQIDKVADVMLKLQEAGIAALWRPFHEAAGNYYATGYKGAAWFWWGADGPDTFKALWKALYDKLDARGVKNLIWVWTSQNTNNGSATKDSAFYPGKDLVDIVARDYYGGNLNDLVTDFNELGADYSDKMVALGECGYGTNGNKVNEMPDMSKIWADGGHYLYAMGWYGGGKVAGTTNTMMSDSWWKNFMSMPEVLNRGDF